MPKPATTIRAIKIRKQCFLIISPLKLLEPSSWKPLLRSVYSRGAALSSILLSEDLRGFHLDTNGILTEQVQGTIRRAQFGQTLSISHSLGKFTISGEVWHFSQPFEKSNTAGNLGPFRVPFVRIWC